MNTYTFYQYGYGIMKLKNSGTSQSTNLGYKFCIWTITLFLLFSCSTEAENEVSYYNWEYNISGSSSIANVVQVVESFDPVSSTFSYYTGAKSGGVGGAILAPTRIESKAIANQVTVLARFDEEVSHEEINIQIEQIAEIIDNVTTEIWPGNAIPVVINYHKMPNEPPFSLAKRISWTEGQPYEIAYFIREKYDYTAITPVHELYHALAIHWRIGKNAPNAVDRINTYSTLEEVAADLFASCGVLLTDGILSYKQNTTRYNLDGRILSGSLSDEELKFLLGLMAVDALNNIYGELLSQTLFKEFFADQNSITLNSFQGEAMLSLCREASPNPAFLEEWFRKISND